MSTVMARDENTAAVAYTGAGFDIANAPMPPERLSASQPSCSTCSHACCDVESLPLPDKPARAAHEHEYRTTSTNNSVNRASEQTQTFPPKRGRLTRCQKERSD